MPVRLPAQKEQRRLHRLYRYRRERAALLARLGNQCALCPERRKEKLEIDHTNGRRYELRKLSRDQRLARWLEEEARGELRLLCQRCNSTEGGARRYGDGPSVIGECS